MTGTQPKRKFSDGKGDTLFTWPTLGILINPQQSLLGWEVRPSGMVRQGGSYLISIWIFLKDYIYGLLISLKINFKRWIKKEHLVHGWVHGLETGSWMRFPSRVYSGCRAHWPGTEAQCGRGPVLRCGSGYLKRCETCPICVYHRGLTHEYFTLCFVFCLFTSQLMWSCR